MKTGVGSGSRAKKMEESKKKWEEVSMQCSLLSTETNSLTFESALVWIAFLTSESQARLREQEEQETISKLEVQLFEAQERVSAFETSRPLIKPLVWQQMLFKSTFSILGLETESPKGRIRKSRGSIGWAEQLVVSRIWRVPNSGCCLLRCQGSSGSFCPTPSWIGQREAGKGESSQSVRQTFPRRLFDLLWSPVLSFLVPWQQNSFDRVGHQRPSESSWNLSRLRCSDQSEIYETSFLWSWSQHDLERSCTSYSERQDSFWTSSYPVGRS